MVRVMNNTKSVSKVDTSIVRPEGLEESKQTQNGVRRRWCHFIPEESIRVGRQDSKLRENILSGSEGRESKLKVMQSYELSKPVAREVLSPARPYLLTLPNSATYWVLSVPSQEPMEDISHVNHCTASSNKLSSPFTSKNKLLYLLSYFFINR